jgi:hypothetical protein
MRKLGVIIADDDFLDGEGCRMTSNLGFGGRTTMLTSFLCHTSIHMCSKQLYEVYRSSESMKSVNSVSTDLTIYHYTKAGV